MKFSNRVNLVAQFLTIFVRYAAQHYDTFQVISRRYCFALIAVALFCAKLVHLFSHRHSLLPAKFVAWGLTFFFQDVIIILLARGLTRNFRQKWAQILTTILAIGIRYVAKFAGLQLRLQNTNIVVFPFQAWLRRTSRST